jgi:hypothetical protein
MLQSEIKVLYRTHLHLGLNFANYTTQAEWIEE